MLAGRIISPYFPEGIGASRRTLAIAGHAGK
jgi:hypothetical protein